MDAHTSSNEEVNSLVDVLISSLMARAHRRTIRQAVIGSRFCGILLDDGSAGVANLCSDICGKPPSTVQDRLPQPGESAADVLMTLASPQRSAIGLATVNALANRPENWDEHQGEEVTKGDLLNVLELRPDDQVGMVGRFSPLVDPITRRVRRLLVFERGPRLTSGLLPESRAGEVLPRCSVAIITATTLLNGTADALLAAAVNCREVVMLGPSTPLLPAVFVNAPRRASLLAGVVVTDAPELLRVIARGGCTREFLGSVTKVNVRVRDVNAGSNRA